MINKLGQKIISAVVIFSLLLNIFSPIVLLRQAYAEETIPTPTSTPDPTPPANSEATPTPAPIDQPSINPTPTINDTPTPTSTPQPTPSSTPTPEAFLTPTPSITLTDTLTPTPTTPTVTPESNPTPTPTKSEPHATWTNNNNAYTTETVKLDVTYKFPLHEKVSLTFTKLPSESGTITIIEHDAPATINNPGSKDYEITSTIPNGSFEFNLTLPTNDPTKTVFASEDGHNYNPLSNEKFTTEDTITIKNINHLTHFITGGDPQNIEHPVINEFYSATSNDWVELYNPIQSNIDLAGWELRDSIPSNSKALSGIIPANGFLVFTWNALNQGGDTISLYNGSTLKDQVVYPGTVAVPGSNQSARRTINGGSTWELATNITQGYTNENSTIYVDDSNTSGNEYGTQTYPFNTIQEGISAVASGGTVNVAAGTYTEDLTIPVTKVSLNLVGAGLLTTTIKGVQNLPAASFPLAAPNIEILADGVKIHEFTIEGPNPANGFYSSGVVIGGANVEIYNNAFKVANASNTDDISQAIQTYRDGNNGAGDLSGLNIHDNSFTSLGEGTHGYEGIFINHTSTDPNPAQSVIINNNQFSGNVLRGITTERSKTTITNNSIITSSLLANTFQGINIIDYGNREQRDVSIIGNTVKGLITGTGFSTGIRVGAGSNAQVLTNVNITNNTVQNNDKGMVIRSSADQVTINSNEISGNILMALENATGTSTFVNATNNWWGSANGPTHVSNPIGTGQGITDNVTYSPWYINSERTIKSNDNPPALAAAYVSGLTTNANVSMKVTGLGTNATSISNCYYSLNNGASWTVATVTTVGSEYYCKTTGIDLSGKDLSNIKVWTTNNLDKTAITTPPAVIDTDAPSNLGTSTTTPNPTNSTTQTWTWNPAADLFAGVNGYWYRVTDQADQSVINSTFTNSLSVVTPLLQGIYNFLLKAEDNIGNQSNETSAILTVDTTAPNAPIITLLDPINNLNKTAVTITGVGEAKAAVNYSITDGTNTINGTSTVNNDNTIGITGINVSTLTDGTLTASATLTDAAGNTSIAGTDNATKNTVLNVGLSLQPATQTVNTLSNFDVQVRIAAGTQEVDTVDANLSFNPTYLQVSSITIGSALPVVIISRWDNTAGTITMTSSKFIAPFPTGTFTLATISFQTLTASTNGSTGTAIAFSTTLPYSSAAYRAGANVTGSIDNASVVVSSPPAIPPDINGLSDNLVPRKSVTWTWTSSNPNAMFRYLIDQSQSADLSSLSYGSTTTASQLNGDGTHYLHIQAKDLAGNESNVFTYSAVLDNSAPASPVVSGPTSPVIIKTTSYPITGTAEAGSLVRVYRGTTEAGRQQLSGTFTDFNINAALLQDQANVLTVTATDIAGNESNQSTIPTITQDSTFPTITSYTLDNSVISPAVTPGIADTATFDLFFSKQVSADIDIVDSNGIKITDIYQSSSVTDPQAIIWDGKNNAGVYVADGAYTIKVVITDQADNSLTDTAKTITVNNQRAPVLTPIGNKSAAELTTVTFTASATDENNDSLTFSLSNAPTGATIDPSTGVFLWTPTEAQGPGSYTFIVTVSDGALSDSEEITVVVSEVNTAPASSHLAFTTDEDAQVTIALIATDADLPTNALTYSIVTTPISGMLSTVTGNQVIYTPSLNFHGADSFTFKASDGSLVSNIATVTITVNPLNDSPIAINDVASITKNTMLNLLTTTLLNNDIDVDADTLLVTSVENALNGTVAIVGSNITFLPSSNFVGLGSFTYTISDGSLTATGTVRVVIYPQVDSSQTVLTPSLTINPASPEVVVSETASDSTITIPSSVTNSTLNVTNLITTQDTIKTATLPNKIALNTNTSLGIVNVQIPAGIQIQGDATAWTGIIHNPKAQSNTSVTIVPPSGFNTTTDAVVEMGFGDIPLTFNKAVRILVTGQAGKLAAYARGEVVTKITTLCNSDTQTVGDALPASGDCKIDVGSDLVIWTKHFTKFVAYTQTAVSATTSTTKTSEGSAGIGESTNPPACSDAKPTSAPVLLSWRAENPNEITLTWSKAKDPVTYYLIAYGTSSGSLQFGNPNIGGSDTTSYAIKGLGGGTTYYFKVRAGNGCMPGEYSNELSVTPFGNDLTEIAEGFETGVLGTTTEQESETKEKESSSTSSAEVLGKEETPTPTKLIENLTKSSKNIFIALIIFAIAIGGFVFWKKRTPQKPRSPTKKK